MNIMAGPGVAIREFPLKTGFADYLLYAGGKAIGVVEAKPEGHTLTGVETQSAKYSDGLPPGLPHHGLPLPFAYESTGTATQFTNNLEPDARSRELFTFHRPAELPRLVQLDEQLRSRLRHMPPLNVEGLWPLKITTLNNLETSLAASRPHREGLRFRHVKELAAAPERPPLSASLPRLWQAYQAIEPERVKGAGGKQLVDVIALVRHAIDPSQPLCPIGTTVQERFDQWLAEKEAAGATFTPQQRQWLVAIKEHIAGSLSIDKDDFDQVPFNQFGGLGKAYELFGDRLQALLEELNARLAA